MLIRFGRYGRVAGRIGRSTHYLKGLKGNSTLSRLVKSADSGMRKKYGFFEYLCFDKGVSSGAVHLPSVFNFNLYGNLFSEIR